MPRSWLITAIGVLASLFTLSMSLIVWNFKRGVARIELAIKRSENTDEAHGALILVTQKMVVEVERSLQMHVAENNRMMDGFAKQSLLSESLNRVHEKINGIDKSVSERLARLEQRKEDEPKEPTS